jgi:hypothetical protein
MKKLVLTLTLALLSTACLASDKSASKDAVLDVLVEPDSAQFGKFTVIPGGNINIKMACLTVNSKNRFGGYTGKQQAALHKEKGTWKVMSMFEITHRECITTLKKVIAARQ